MTIAGTDGLAGDGTRSAGAGPVTMGVPFGVNAGAAGRTG